MKRSILVPLLILCLHVVVFEAKYQQQAVDIDDSSADEDRDEDEDDDEDDGRPEIDDDGKIYKNPRNSPSAICPRNEKQVEVLGQKCLRRCSTDEDCKSKKKKCRCDGPCGMSCIKPERECPELTKFDNGKLIVSGRFFGNQATYTCDQNHFIVGLAERICRADGRWSGNTPVCIADPYSFCTEPPRGANAKHYIPPEQKGFLVNSTVQYFCDYGYQTTGFPESKCIQLDGKANWFGPDLTCDPISCGKPQNISNGHFIGECYTFDCRISYFCDKEFKLSGRSEKVCQADGTWFPKELPQCIYGTPAQCPLPENPANGKATYTSHAYNAIVSYECKYGYILTGSATRKCQADRKWSGQAPVCAEINCGSPGILYNGWIENIEAGTGLGVNLIFRCKEHMKLIGNTSSTCDDNGQWRNPLPHCLAPCIIPQIEKGYIKVASRQTDQINNVTVVEHGERLLVFCDENYEFASNNTPVLCNNGTWSIIPSCSPARCKLLPKSPKNGMVIAPKMNHGMRAIFKCKDGFTLVGGGPDNSSKHVECHYGTWEGDPPHCIEVYCAFPGYVENGKVLLVGNMGVYDYRPYVKKVPNNKQIMYDCNKGFVLNEGPTGATCVGGNWSPRELPVCLPGQHPRIRWSRRRRSINAIQQPQNKTKNFDRFVDFFRRFGTKLLHIETDNALQNESLPLGLNFTATNLIESSNTDDKILEKFTDIYRRHENGSHFGVSNHANTKKKTHNNKNHSKNEKLIEFLRVAYKKLKRIDSERVDKDSKNISNMHDLLNLMSKNIFHVDLSEPCKNNATKVHEKFDAKNQREFFKLKREFEKTMKFYNKSLRWSEKQMRKEGKAKKREKTSKGSKQSKDKKRINKENKLKNYYRGFYEFINGYVNEKLTILEAKNSTDQSLEGLKNNNFNVINGTSFSVGEMYAFFKHIVEGKLKADEVTTATPKIVQLKLDDKVQQSPTAVTKILTVENNSVSHDIALEDFDTVKHRTKRIRNISEVKSNNLYQNRKLFSINSSSNAGKTLPDDIDRNAQDVLMSTAKFTLKGLEAQQQSRSKRFLPRAELDNQINLKNFYLNAYEDGYRTNVRRSNITSSKSSYINSFSNPETVK